jgi:hypothetical protein
MSWYQTLALVGAIGFVVVGVWVASRATPDVDNWRSLGMILIVFTLVSGYALTTEGPSALWNTLTSSAWGLQVWFDLLIALGVVWLLLQPQLRALGVNPWPWFLLILGTGSIGMLACVIWLRFTSANTDKDPALHTTETVR